MNVNMKGIVGKLAKNADLAGGLLGFLTGSTHGIGDVESSITNIMAGQVHIPDVKTMLDSYLGQPYFKNALYLYLFGWVAKELKLPVVGKYGKAIEKFATAYGAGSFMNMLLWSSTHSDEGSAPQGGLFNFRSSSPNQTALGYSY